MKKVKTRCSVFAGSVILFCVLSFVASTELSAQTVAIQGTSYNVTWSFKDNLKSLTGKDIYVSLRSGKIYQGYIKAVGDNFVHLEKIVGKDFYDALIRIEDISAIEARFRDFK